MANTSSAKKAERVAQRRAVYNARRKKAVKDAVKAMEKLVAKKSGPEATKALPTLYKAIDKAVKGGTLNKNTGARMKSKAAKTLRTIAV